jgi:hypothetical protein
MIDSNFDKRFDKVLDYTLAEIKKEIGEERFNKLGTGSCSFFNGTSKKLREAIQSDTFQNKKVRSTLLDMAIEA